MDGPMPEAAKTVAVVGATGFVGRAVVARLTEAGFEDPAEARHRIEGWRSGKARSLRTMAAAEAFEAVFDGVVRQLRKGERVQVPGFGSFAVSKRAARQGRNPKTGETIKIKASKSVRFKVGKELKDKLN